MYYCDSSVTRKPKGLQYVSLSKAHVVLYDSTKVKKKPVYKGKKVVSLRRLKKAQKARKSEVIEVPRDFLEPGTPIQNLGNYYTMSDKVSFKQLEEEEDPSTLESIRQAQKIAFEKGFISPDKVSSIPFMEDVDASQQRDQALKKEPIEVWYAKWLKKLQRVELRVRVIAAIPFPAKLPEQTIDSYKNPYTAYEIYQFVSELNDLLKELRNKREELKEMVDNELDIDKPNWYNSDVYKRQLRDKETEAKDANIKEIGATGITLITGIVVGLSIGQFFGWITAGIMAAAWDKKIYAENLAKELLTLKNAEEQFVLLSLGTSKNGIAPVWLERLEEEKYWTKENDYAFLHDFKRTMVDQWPNIRNEFYKNHNDWKDITLGAAFENIFTFMCQSALQKEDKMDKQNKYQVDERCELHQPSVYLTSLETVLSVMGENVKLIHFSSTNESICEQISEIAKQIDAPVSNATLDTYHKAVYNHYPHTIDLMFYMIHRHLSTPMKNKWFTEAKREWQKHDMNNSKKKSFILYAMIITLGGICHINHTFLEWLLHHDNPNVEQESKKYNPIKKETADMKDMKNLYEFGKIYEKQAYDINSAYTDAHDLRLFKTRKDAQKKLKELSEAFKKDFKNMNGTVLVKCNSNDVCGYTLSQLVQAFYTFYRQVDENDSRLFYLNDYRLNLTHYKEPKEVKENIDNMTDLGAFLYESWQGHNMFIKDIRSSVTTAFWSILESVRVFFGNAPTQEIVGIIQPRRWAEYFRDIINHHGFHVPNDGKHYSSIYDMDIKKGNNSLQLSEAIDRTSEEFKNHVTKMLITRHEQPIHMPVEYTPKKEDIKREQFILLAIAGLCALPDVKKLIDVRKDWYNITHRVIV